MPVRAMVGALEVLRGQLVRHQIRTQAMQAAVTSLLGRGTGKSKSNASRACMAVDDALRTLPSPAALEAALEGLHRFTLRIIIPLDLQGGLYQLPWLENALYERWPALSESIVLLPMNGFDTTEAVKAMTGQVVRAQHGAHAGLLVFQQVRAQSRRGSILGRVWFVKQWCGTSECTAMLLQGWLHTIWEAVEDTRRGSSEEQRQQAGEALLLHLACEALQLHLPSATLAQQRELACLHALMVGQAAFSCQRWMRCMSLALEPATCCCCSPVCCAGARCGQGEAPAGGRSTDHGAAAAG